ncbi:MAG: hypothetical protein HZB91_04860 [Elusimicrobia bacterium]|nr:hypothetical protein [Elusimicrobiota bacterium]
MPRLTAILFAAALSSACVPLQLRPYPINAQAEDLGIRPQDKQPLSVAVVVPDPMGNRMLVTTRICGVGAIFCNDFVKDVTSTQDLDNLFPVARELSKVAQDTFSQAFRHVTVLRQLPQPGEYDVVAAISIIETRLNRSTKMTLKAADAGEIVFVFQWQLRVLDKENVELFSRKDITPPSETNRFQTAASLGFSSGPLNGTPAYLEAVGATAADRLAWIARECAGMVAGSKPKERP